MRTNSQQVLNQHSKHLMIVAGEASGDMHAAELVSEILKANPEIRVSGLGGPKMQAAGVELIDDLTHYAVVGFFEVFKNYWTCRKIFKQFVATAKIQKPDAVILVDYPGFNLPLAKELSESKIKIIYYISPQLWAWHKSRIKQIKKFVNQMIVLFPFEKTFYKNHGVQAHFAGHPLLDQIKIRETKESIINKLSLKHDVLTIGLLPGSRMSEVKKILPPMIDATLHLKKQFPSVQFVIVKAPSIPRDYLEQFGIPDHIVISDLPSYDLINACNLCMVASGTATLETAMLKKPMVIIYKTSFLTYLLARLLIKIPHIGLVNIVAERKVVPECIQTEATGKKIADELKNIFTNEIKIADIKSDLEEVKRMLGDPGASSRTAQFILQSLS